MGVIQKTDILFANPPIENEVYQSLSSDVAARELPVWLALLAAAVRKKGFAVGALDCVGMKLTVEKAASQITEMDPRLIVIIVYGQHASASTQTMYGASLLCSRLKKINPGCKILLVGGHVSALPERTLTEESCDFVCEGEGLTTILELLKTDLFSEPQLAKVPSLWYKSNTGKNASAAETNFKALKNPSAPLLTSAQLDIELGDMALDLLPLKNYRAPNWFCFDDLSTRDSYAALYTTLGCPYKCEFCCINAPFGKPNYRFWDVSTTMKHFDAFAKAEIKNVKIVDELFLLNDKHVEAICDGLIERNYKFNIWAFSRIDTIPSPPLLKKLKRAGFNWLVMGIESPSQSIRTNVQKGQYGEQKIRDSIRMIQEYGIRAHGNFIFGLPDDNFESMQHTLDFSIDLKIETANFYCAMAYPGSKLYTTAVANKTRLPDSWLGYSQLSPEALPLPTKHLSAEQVLTFRDQAWEDYHKSPIYLDLVLRVFGQNTYEYVKSLSQKRISRKYGLQGQTLVRGYVP